MWGSRRDAWGGGAVVQDRLEVLRCKLGRGVDGGGGGRGWRSCLREPRCVVEDFVTRFGHNRFCDRRPWVRWGGGSVTFGVDRVG